MGTVTSSLFKALVPLCLRKERKGNQSNFFIPCDGLEIGVSVEALLPTGRQNKNDIMIFQIS